MANDRWEDEGPYRPRRYGHDTDYERNFWRDRESGGREWRGRGSGAEDMRERYTSLPVFGIDHSGARRLRGRESSPGWDDNRYQNERYYEQQYRGDDIGRDYGNDWRARGRGERSWWDRTKDEVRSWMGDPEAEHRREADHRGRGPRGYTRSDERIRDDVSDRLMEDWQVDATDIEVTVAAAEVTLSGTVDSRAAKRRAENLAADVLGVKDVQNRLRVQPGLMNEERASAPVQSSSTTGTTTTGTTGQSTGTAPPSTPRH
jgi:osmotically-inducible protein OsmY